MGIKRPDRFAESLFANLCDREGVSCTPVHHDDKGWDFFIEFPAEGELNLPPDMRSAPVKCLIQIKSVSKGAYRVKLSNALAFSKSELPCFVVAVVFDGGDGSDPVGAVVHHHWLDEIKASLLRARELHAKGRDDTHHFFLTRRAPRTEALGVLDIIPAIKNVVAEKKGYSAQKLAYTESVGYEDAAAVGSFTVKLESEDDFVDLHIGLKDSVEVTRFEIANQRFGIRARASTLFEGAGRVSVSVDPKPCTLVLRPDNLSPGVSLAAQLYTPAIPGLTPEEFKFRVVSKFVELIASFGSKSCTFNIRWEGAERYSVLEMADLIDVLSIAHAGEIDFSLRFDNAKVFGASGPVKGLELPPHLDVIKAFLRLVAGAEERRGNTDDRISLVELYEKLERIHEFNGLAEGAGVTIRFKATGLAEIADSGPIVYTHGIEFGDWLVISLVRRSYQMEKGEDGLIILQLGPVEKSITGVEATFATDIEARWGEELRRTERTIKEREDCSAILIENLHMMGESD